MVTMSNPGLPLAIVGNPGPRRRSRTTRRRTSPKGKKKMAFTKKQARALAKAWRARGKRVPSKIARKLRNPGTKAGARKARRRKAIKTSKRRARRARSYRRKLPRGIKVVVRRKVGKRRKSRKFGKKYGIRTGRYGGVSFRRGRKQYATNPKRRRGKKRRSGKKRRNPTVSVSSWKQGIFGLPKNLPKVFSGKGMVTNVGFAAGGAIGTLVVGGMLRGTVMSVLPASIAQNRLLQGVIGAALSYTGGYGVGQLLIKNERRRTAFITGAATAAVINLIMPGAVNRFIGGLPVVGSVLSQLPGMQGIGAYVEAPGYQAVGYMPNNALAAYVEAPGYQAVGSYADDALAGELGAYVEAPSYQAVGMYGASHLDQ